MKRTFGKFMSLLLVLAMLLAMIPTVLAATTTITSFTGKAKTLAPYKETTINYSEEKAAAATPGTGKAYAETITKWEASDYNKVELTVAEGAQSATIKSRGGTGTVTITAYYTATDKNGTTSYKTAATWKVTITDWSITLSPNTTTYTKPTSLTAGERTTLTATVKGADGWLEKLDVKVKFTSDAENIAAVSADKVQGLYLGGSTSQGTASTYVSAGTGNGIVRIEVALVTVSGETETAVIGSDGNPVTADFWVEVGGSSEYKIELASDVMTVTYNETASKIVPTLYQNGTKVTKNVTFTYSSSNTNLVYVNPDGTIKLQDGNQKKTGTAKVTVKAAISGNELATTAICTVDVVESKITSMTLELSEASYKALVTDGKKFCASTTSGQAVTTFTIVPTVLPGDTIKDRNRIVWESSDKSIATVKQNTTDGTATVTAVGYGKFSITATLGELSKAVTFDMFSTGNACYAWQEVKYTKINSKPTISGPISNTGINDAIDAIARQNISVTLQGTGKAYELPILKSSVQPQYTADGKIYFTGTIDGIDADNHVLYCPTKKGNDTFTTDTVGLSSIAIITQPVDTNYKVGSAGTLTITARTGQSGDYLTSFQWFNKKHELVYSDVISGTNTTLYTSTLDLASRGVIDSSENNNGFYCKVISYMSEATSNIASVDIQGDYTMDITLSAEKVSAGGTIKASAVAKKYDPSASGSDKYTAISGNYTITWTVDQPTLVTLSKATVSKGETITITAKSGGTVKLTAKTTDASGNVYESTVSFTITVPTANDVTVALEDGAKYVLLDGTKISDAVKTATKTAPSFISFTQPATGNIYTTSALGTKITNDQKYAISDVSKMAFSPTTNAGSYSLEYKAYDANGQIAEGKVVVMTSAGVVEYHVSSGEAQAMSWTDFQSAYGTGLSTIVFGDNTDTRGGLYKGSTTSSTEVGSESYSSSTLKNVYFIAGSSTAKYTVTIPFTANGSNGEKTGNLVVYVNDTHNIASTGATFRSMSIASELAPENASTSDYIVITNVTGGTLYTSYTSIKSNTPFTFSGTKYSFSGSNSIDNLYLLPTADSKEVVVSYTINGSDKGTLTFKVTSKSASSNFSDVSGSNSWAANSVDFMYANGLVNGVSATAFGPQQSMTRAMLVTILYRAAGEPSVTGITNKFTDNKESQYYYNAVLWASSKGIVNGATTTTFDPDGKITREQIAAILYRYAGSPSASGSLSSFSDQSQVSSYAVTAMQWAVGKGIITGVSTNGRTTLSAKANATRAQVAVMLHRFLTFE